MTNDQDHPTDATPDLDAPSTEPEQQAEDIIALFDSELIDSTGEKVGAVHQVFFDDSTGQPAWVTVDTGLLGTRTRFVPLQDAQVWAGEVRVPYTKKVIHDAPPLEAVDDGDESNGIENLYRYYDVSPGGPLRPGS